MRVSIDGSTPITHDAFRGKGNFFKAMEGIKVLQKHHIPVPVRVTIHRQNVRDLEGVARLLLEEVGLPSSSTNAASYMGLCRQNTEQVQLTVEERSLAMETLLELNKKYNFGHDLFPHALSQGISLYGCPLVDGEFLIDIGTPESYRWAQQRYVGPV